MVVESKLVVEKCWLLRGRGCLEHAFTYLGKQGWRMEDGGWRMEDGGWRMEEGKLNWEILVGTGYH